MANADFSDYRKFLEEFAATVDPTDQLPVKVAGYLLTEAELTGEIIDWTCQYLTDKKCPPSLVAPILNIIVDETSQTYTKTPELCGYNADLNAYQPLKLMQTVIAKVNDVCQRLLDNTQLDTIPPPPPAQRAAPRYAVSAIKNSRRKMEDRHVVIDDFNAVFGIDDPNRASYYAIFDGHAGVDAAHYAVSHLHCHLAASGHYPDRPAEAMLDAFHITDTEFLRKCEKQKLISGTTALCALYRPVEQRLYVGWLGDSKAMLVTEGNIMQIVRPHKPDLPSEKKRIRDLGGTVMMYGGMYRVNGALAVSRAIGDPGHRPFVCGDPDIISVPLNGNEDFLILACDGLWDHVTEDDVAFFVYKQVRENPDNIDRVPKRLTELSVIQGSGDNISVIVVFLKDPHEISRSTWPSAWIPAPLDNMDTAYDNNTNEDIFQKANLLHDLGIDKELKSTSPAAAAIPTTDDLNNITDLDDLTGGIDSTLLIDAKPAADFIFGNGSTPQNVPTNGNAQDLGPETDVDSVDEAVHVTPIGDFISEFVHKNGDEMRTALNRCDDRNENFEEEDEDDSFESYMIKPNDSRVYDDSLEDTVGEELMPQPSKNPFVDEVEEAIVDKINPFNDGNEFINDNKLPIADQHELIDSSKKVIDFSEKKEFSFDREKFEEEDGIQSAMEEAFDLADRSENTNAVSPSIPVNEFVDDEHNGVNETGDELNGLKKLSINDELEVADDVVSEPQIDELSTFTAPEALHDSSVDHHKTAENVVVPESGDESEDEWNYIKVHNSPPASLDCEKHNNDHVGEPSLTQPEPDNSNPDNIGTEFENVNEVPSDEAPVTFSESHAIAQALAESHEELLVLDHHETDEEDHRDDVPEPELLQLEENASGAAAIDLDTNITPIKSTVLNADDDEDMDSQLNPDAKEFVPVVSPQSTPTRSPFGNGDVQLRRPELQLDDDCVLAQSPRKGGTTMENITIPSEVDFDIDIANRPKELVEVSFHDDSNGLATSPPEVLNGNERPGSSSSQYSYQEMNLKEAMHGDEKQEYALEDAVVSPSAAACDELSAATDPLSDVTSISNTNELNDKFLCDADPMNMSFYNDGTSNTCNPFAVDMNAVQVLPVDDDDETTSEQDENKPYHLEGDAGQHFVIQDTAFGMNGARSNTNSLVEVTDEISKPEEDQFSPLEHKELQPEDDYDHLESDKPEADHQSFEPSSIVEVVKEMASEVTSLLNDVSLNDQPKFDIDHLMDDPSSIHEKHEENTSEITATPTDEVPCIVDSTFEKLTEAEQHYSQANHEIQTEAVLAMKSVEDADTLTAAPTEHNEAPSEETAQDRIEHTLTKVLGGEVVSVEDEKPLEAAAPTTDAILSTDGAVADVVEMAADRLQTTGTATPTTLVSKKPAPSPKTSTTSKKPEAKTTTTKTSTLSKKPPTSASTLTSRPAASAKLAAANKPTTTTNRTSASSSALTARPRTVASAPLTKTTASNLAAKKPVPNGEAKSSSTLLIKKTTTSTASTITKSAAAKPLLKPTVRAPISSNLAATASKSTTAAPTARAITSATTTKTSSITRALIQRPSTTSAPPKPRLLTTSSAPKPSTARTSNGLSPIKPSNSINKLGTTRTSAGSTPTRTSTTLKKTTDDTTKSPSSRPIVKSTLPPALTKRSTGASTTTTTSSSTLAAAKRSTATTTTRTSLAPVRGSPGAPSPIKKRVSSTTTTTSAIKLSATAATTTVSTTVVTNGGNEIKINKEERITDSTQVINSIDGDAHTDNGQPLIATNQQTQVIDLIDD